MPSVINTHYFFQYLIRNLNDIRDLYQLHSSDMRHKKNPQQLEAIRVLTDGSSMPIDLINIIADYASESLYRDIRNVINALVREKTLIRIGTTDKSWNVLLTYENGWRENLYISWNKVGSRIHNIVRFGLIPYSIKCILNGGTSRHRMMPTGFFSPLCYKIRKMAQQNPEIL